jgi:redox-sensitive bicupin YhaK (pirin superfamily)
MLRKIDNKNLFIADHGWLKSRFHFSFAEYYNQDNINFGVLRVVNDDLIEPKTGFPTHPHRDMEIISYVVNGDLTHQDSMGNKHSLSRGEVQYMSAGTGITHSEYNMGNTTTRLLQIWILPDSKGHTPNYGELKPRWEDRVDKFMHFVSGKDGDAPIKVNQDVNFYAAELSEGKNFVVGEERQAYLVLIEGEAKVNNVELVARDALEIIEEDIYIQPKGKAHVLVIEMKKDS